MNTLKIVNESRGLVNLIIIPMENNTEKYYPALRLFVEKYKAQKKREKYFHGYLVLFIFVSILFPPFGLLTAAIFIYYIVHSHKLALTKCPQCDSYFMSFWARLLGTGLGKFSPGYLSCVSCGLKVCELPEIECRHGNNYKDER